MARKTEEDMYNKLYQQFTSSAPMSCIQMNELRLLLHRLQGDFKFTIKALEMEDEHHDERRWARLVMNPIGALERVEEETKEALAKLEKAEKSLESKRILLWIMWVVLIASTIAHL